MLWGIKSSSLLLAVHVLQRGTEDVVPVVPHSLPVGTGSARPGKDVTGIRGNMRNFKVQKHHEPDSRFTREIFSQKDYPAGVRGTALSYPLEQEDVNSFRR